MPCENDGSTEKEGPPPLPDQSRKSQTHVCQESHDGTRNTGDRRRESARFQSVGRHSLSSTRKYFLSVTTTTKCDCLRM